MEELGLTFDLGENEKLCPVCGYNFVFPTRVCVALGKESIDITDDYTIIEKTHKESTNVRGVIIVREFVCESGHHWKESEQFHKGCTYMQTEILDDVDMENMLHAHIWRD